MSVKQEDCISGISTAFCCFTSAFMSLMPSCTFSVRMIYIFFVCETSTKAADKSGAENISLATRVADKRLSKKDCIHCISTSFDSDLSLFHLGQLYRQSFLYVFKANFR